MNKCYECGAQCIQGNVVVVPHIVLRNNETGERILICENCRDVIVKVDD